MTDNHGLELVAAVRAAGTRRETLNRQWRRTRPVMWLLAAAAITLLALGSPIAAPAVLTLAALAIGGNHVRRNIRADRDWDQAWTAFAEYTHLDAAVEHFTNGTGPDTTKTEDDQ